MSLNPAQLRTTAEIRALASNESIREVRGELSTADLLAGVPLDGIVAMVIGRGPAADLLAAVAEGRELTVAVTCTRADAGHLVVTVDTLAAALETAEARHAEWLRAA